MRWARTPRLRSNGTWSWSSISTASTTTRPIAWSELDRAEIQRVSAARPIEAALDSLMLVTTDGRKVVISAPIAPAQVAQLRETITRVATRARSTRPVR